MPGYVNLDIKDGFPIDDLRYDDGSVAEIRASHVLEHVSWADTHRVIQHWYNKLEPGGLCKIAVPNFDWCIDAYMKGMDEPIEAYVMGGHVDKDDRHGAIFNRRKLEKLMRMVGFVDIGTWPSDHNDCSSKAVSLNLEGRKPDVDASELPNVVMCMTAPRVGFTNNMAAIVHACHRLKIEFVMSNGAFWNQCLERIMTTTLKEKSPEYILTVDYDSFFYPEDIRSLYRIAKRHDLDAVCALQVKREEPLALLGMFDDTGKRVTTVSADMSYAEKMEVASGHFGLTLIKASKLSQLPHPWFLGTPNKDGEWEDGRTDDDIHFWHKWRAAGNRLFVSPRVRIGHLQLVCSWPDQLWRPHHQYLNELTKNGPPDCTR